MNATVDCELLVLGAGLAGLAAASTLGRRAIVVERASQPGGLVRTDRFGDYWLDWSVHLLYFDDPETEREVRSLLGDVLAPCPPRARVVTKAGDARYPVQLHLGDLHAEATIAALLGMAQAAYGPHSSPRHFAEMLRASFGEALCELFFFPYNRKLYKRNLETLAPGGFQWNIVRPDLAQALRGALVGGTSAAYNAKGWYPRPAAGSEHRGIGGPLARAGAYRGRSPPRPRGRRHRSEATSRRCHASRRAAVFPLREGMLRDVCRSIGSSRCASTYQPTSETNAGAFATIVSGPSESACEGGRPADDVHWRYFPDEDLVFHRLVYPHAFDGRLVPADGWSILAEITEPGESEPAPADALVARVLDDLRSAGQLPADATIVGAHRMDLEPGYVVFGLEDQPIVEKARHFLARHGMSTVGRYARWEYSSMAQVMRDGFAWRSTWKDRG